MSSATKIDHSIPPQAIADRLRAMAEEFAAMPERPAAEVSLAAANVLRGFADEVDEIVGQLGAGLRYGIAHCELEKEPSIHVQDALTCMKAMLGVDGGASGDAPGMTTPAKPKDDSSIMERPGIPAVVEVSGWDVRGYQPHGWKVVDANTPRGQRLVFWIVTKPDAEQWQDSSGRSINYGKTPVERLHIGQFGSWSASMKATHWQHEYNYGRPGVGLLPGEEKPEP